MFYNSSNIFYSGGIAGEIGVGIFEFNENNWKLVGNLSKRRELPAVTQVKEFVCK